MITIMKKQTIRRVKFRDALNPQIWFICTWKNTYPHMPWQCHSQQAQRCLSVRNQKWMNSRVLRWWPWGWNYCQAQPEKKHHKGHGNPQCSRLRTASRTQTPTRDKAFNPSQTTKAILQHTIMICKWAEHCFFNSVKRKAMRSRLPATVVDQDVRCLVQKVSAYTSVGIFLIFFQFWDMVYFTVCMFFLFQFQHILPHFFFLGLYSKICGSK